ncbi:aminodeoxychorismate lyase [marine bacterium AO1-C]|nr:aminodeoxychorismate lyase [marine bacterium AO1-C]
MSRRRKIFIMIMVAISMVTVTVTFYGYQLIKTPNFQVDKKDAYLYIPQGANFKTVLDSLKKNDQIQNTVSFAFLSKLMKYQENVKPGRYLIKRSMTNQDAVRMLRSGKQAPVKLTFNNVRLKQDLIKKVAKNVNFKPAQLEKLLNDPKVASKYGFDTTTIVSMFLPNTYQVYWNTSPEKLLDRMHREYKKFWNKSRLEKAKNLGMKPQEVSVLASIVQAETNKNDEKARIAGVYINRLQKGIPLEADPTLVFALQDFGLKRVLNKHKEIKSPYNTYKNKGLPPGPINIPSISSLKAVLDYEQHDYLFFCAKADFSGYHAFAKTNAQHERNARLYHKALNMRRIR